MQRRTEDEIWIAKANTIVTGRNRDREREQTCNIMNRASVREGGTVFPIGDLVPRGPARHKMISRSCYNVGSQLGALLLGAMAMAASSTTSLRCCDKSIARNGKCRESKWCSSAL